LTRMDDRRSGVHGREGRSALVVGSLSSLNLQEVRVITFFGIDPGVNGGIAYLCQGVATLYSFKDRTLGDMVKLFDLVFKGVRGESKVILERVHAMPSKFRGCSTSWTLAENYATLKTLLTVYEVPYEVVLPEKWQTVMGVRIKKTKQKVDKKKINREKAQALFPKTAGITLDTADALLIAEYNRRTHR
jgi:hypothetical protein